MPLSDPSKSKVSLASLSATTAAAAESLWSRSKKSAKKKSSSSGLTHPNSNNKEVSPCSSSTTSVPVNSTEAQIHQLSVDRHEFRRRFLEGLQFYCENSSLILNSDLPADLIEFVTSHGFSVEALGIILELKKSSSAFSSVVDKKTVSNPTVLVGTDPTTDRLAGDQNFSEISRRLLQHWMSADSCAEAFVSLSLGEEIPGLIAECARFQRILFAVPDSFHIVNKDFLNYLLSQVLLTISALSHGIKSSSEADGEQVNVRTHAVASTLDRILARYFSDAEYFYTATEDESYSANYLDNPFLNFVAELVTLCEKDLIARRLVAKVFLHQSSPSAFKLAKILFCYQYKDSSAATVILYPPGEFLENNAQWKHILQSLPVKIVTNCKRFWSSWATYIEKESKAKCDTFWHKCVDHWIILNKSSLVDEHSLYSSTLALVALSRQIKANRIDNCNEEQEIVDFVRNLDPSKVVQNVIHSLESINENKKASGMALAEIVAELQFSMPSFKNSSEAPRPLKFDSNSEKYVEILDFYKNGIKSEECRMHRHRQLEEESEKIKKIQVLDSDDDAEEEGKGSNVDEYPTLGEVNSIPEIGPDPRVMQLRARKKKIPMYFSEIVEVLLESSKNEDEAEILKCVVVLKIPVLVFAGAKIDAKMCTTISRCLADLDDENCLHVPILTALYELFTQHPFEVADLLGNVVFNREQYTLGQRILNLNRLLQIVVLTSKQSCFNCLYKMMAKYENELLGIYPEYIGKYFAARKTLRYCPNCKRNEPQSNETDGVGSSHAEQKETKEQESLTWREIVDQRVAAKTKYFVTPRSKTIITVPDEYSSKLVPLLWSSIANRLTHKSPYYLDNDSRVKSGYIHDYFLVQIFQYLGKCILGTSGTNCPHFRNLASHAGELVTNFLQHEDANVRRSVLSLLGIVLHVGEGKSFVIEALSSQENMLKKVDLMINVEKDHENLKLLTSIQQFLAGCTAAEMLQNAVIL